MEYFIPSEFRGSYELLNRSLKVKLDFLRDICGCEVELSNSDLGFARYLGSDKSTHNIDKWDELLAVDGYIPDNITYDEFYSKSKQAGFTGIGLYSGWSSGKRGFHLDVRPILGNLPATWSGIYNPQTEETTYHSIGELLND